jgi:acetylornithine aminotransferase
METIFQEEFLKDVREKSVYLSNKLIELLEPIPVVKEIRQLGMMVGIETDVNLPSLLKELREKGVLALPAGENVLRLLPPLTATAAEINQAAETLKSTLLEYSKSAV